MHFAFWVHSELCDTGFKFSGGLKKVFCLFLVGGGVGAGGGKRATLFLAEGFCCSDVLAATEFVWPPLLFLVFLLFDAGFRLVHLVTGWSVV